MLGDIMIMYDYVVKILKSSCATINLLFPLPKSPGKKKVLQVAEDSGNLNNFALY